MEWKDLAAIDQLSSAPVRVWGWPTFWLSSAKLEKSYDLQFGGRFPVPLYATGWGRTRQASKQQAQREAIKLQATCLTQTKELEWPNDPPKILGTWMLDQIDRGRIGKLQMMEIPRVPERHLLKTKMRIHFVRTSKYYVTCAHTHTLEGGIVFATGVGSTSTDAARAAVRALYLRHRRFQNFTTGREQILDQIDDQRLFAWGISTTRKLQFENAMAQTSHQTEPEITIRTINGPWGTLLKHDIKDLEPAAQGPLERMVI